MGLSLTSMCRGVIIESSTESITGPYLYSHTRNVGNYELEQADTKYETSLNKFTRFPILGSIGGVIRIALSILHTLGHACAYVITRNKGHKYHAIAGICHLLRGVIETIPIIGQVFTNKFTTGDKSYWMIKMYNPNKPDNFDRLLNEESIAILEENSLYIRA